MEQKSMTEIISEMDFFAQRIKRLNDNEKKAGDLKESVEKILDAQFCFAELKELYDTDAEYKEVVDTARFEQARLIEQTRNNLLPIYKKKLNALAKELAGGD